MKRVLIIVVQSLSIVGVLSAGDGERCLDCCEQLASFNQEIINDIGPYTAALTDRTNGVCGYPGCSATSGTCEANLDNPTDLRYSYCEFGEQIKDGSGQLQLRTGVVYNFNCIQPGTDENEGVLQVVSRVEPSTTQTQCETCCNSLSDLNADIDDDLSKGGGASDLESACRFGCSQTISTSTKDLHGCDLNLANENPARLSYCEVGEALRLGSYSMLATRDAHRYLLQCKNSVLSIVTDYNALPTKAECQSCCTHFTDLADIVVDMGSSSSTLLSKCKTDGCSGTTCSGTTKEKAYCSIGDALKRHGRGVLDLTNGDSFTLNCVEGELGVLLAHTPAPTPRPTTLSPTKKPTTLNPTKKPTFAPTRKPTTLSPTTSPTTRHPTLSPTKSPTHSPTKSPTFAPSRSPTKSPTHAPSESPTFSPTFHPSTSPTTSPTFSPSTSPTTSPTFSPSTSPTTSPTKSPTTLSPSASPSISPTFAPSTSPTTSPTRNPTTLNPTKSPTTPAPSQSPVTESPTVNADLIFGIEPLYVYSGAGGLGGVVLLVAVAFFIVRSRRKRHEKKLSANTSFLTRPNNHLELESEKFDEMSFGNIEEAMESEKKIEDTRKVEALTADTYRGH